MSRKTMKSVALDLVPTVNECLVRLALGTLEEEGTSAFIGRNDNWAGTTSAGVGVFVKRLGEVTDESLRRFRRAVAFDEAVQAIGLHSPALLGRDEPSRLLVSALLSDARTGSDLAADDEFDPDLAHRAGRFIGRLHSLPPGAAMDTSEPPLPSLALLTALPLPMFTNLTFAELGFWRLLHSDPPLVDALRRLREWERAAPKRPVHCDLRLDQFLLSDGELYLSDGEEFRLADPARDVGAFAGEWLFQAVVGMAGPDPDDGTIDRSPTHEEIVARGVRELDRLRPLTQRFWAGYRETCAEIDDDLAVRATAFAGWHLMDRTIVNAERSSRLTATVRAAMGIGRNALLAPAKFTAAVGLEAQQ